MWTSKSNFRERIILWPIKKPDDNQLPRQQATNPICLVHKKRLKIGLIYSDQRNHNILCGTNIIEIN